MLRNVASQKWRVYAWDTTTGLAKTGDAANITGRIRIDDGSSAATNDANPTEASSTNEKGYYDFDLTQAETNGAKISLVPASSTSNIQVVACPPVVYTRPQYFSALGIESDGHAHADVKEIEGSDATNQITTAATAATPAAASVTGDVGGKVLGGGAGTITGTGVRGDVRAWNGTAPGNLDGNGFVPANFAALNGNSGRATKYADLADAGSVISASIAAAVWNALTSGLSTASSIGKLLVDNINATISSRSSHTAANVRTEMDSNSTQFAAIVADTNELQTNQGNWLTATGFSTHSAADVVTALGTGSSLTALASQTSVDGVKAVTDKLDDTLEDDGGTYRFTANALEEAPTGGGGGDSKEDIYTYFTSEDRELVFQADVSALATSASQTTIEGKIDDVKAKTAQLDFTGTGSALKSESTNMRGTDNAYTGTPPTVEQIDTQLSGTHGAGSWEGGEGGGGGDATEAKQDAMLGLLQHATYGLDKLARTGADGDTLETLSDQLDGVSGGGATHITTETTIIEAG